MLEAINRHGLKRYIPSSVRREVRKRSGFGCVICGSGIYEYEHVDPLWIDCHEHNPDNMTLLCMQCHGKKTRGMLSITTIRDAMASPQASRQGFSNEMFDFGKDHPYLVFASNTFQNCLIPIMVNGNPLFKIEAPEEVGAPFRLSGELYDSKGIKSLFIKENEWRAFNSNWDIETIGPKITIRESSSELSLVLRLMPPDGIVIEKVKMLYENWFFEGDAVTLKANGASLSANNVTNSNVGFYFG